jgi:ATP-dependent Clp protease ATP-binding subunit ClpC
MAEAVCLNHRFVGTGHLLLGLTRDQNDTAARLLLNLGLNLDSIRDAVLQYPRLSQETIETDTSL